MDLRKLARNNSDSLFESLRESERTANRLKAQVAIAILKKRKEMSMTQSEFASYLNVTQGFVSRLEAGEFNLSIEKICNLCEKLDLQCDFKIQSRSQATVFPFPVLWQITGPTPPTRLMFSVAKEGA